MLLICASALAYVASHVSLLLVLASASLDGWVASIVVVVVLCSPSIHSAIHSGGISTFIRKIGVNTRKLIIALMFLFIFTVFVNNHSHTPHSPWNTPPLLLSLLYMFSSTTSLINHTRKNDDNGGGKGTREITLCVCLSKISRGNGQQVEGIKTERKDKTAKSFHTPMPFNKAVTCCL